MFHYFHPYRYLYDDDWDAVLKETLPKVAHAENSRAYHLAVAEWWRTFATHTAS